MLAYLTGAASRRVLARTAALTLGFVSVAANAAVASMQDDGGGTIAIVLGFIVVLCGAFYFLPTLIAFLRQHHFRWVILAINVAAGWTVLGWLVAFAWSVWPSDKSLVDPVIGNPTGLSDRNAGDTVGAYNFGKIRGFESERSKLSMASRWALSSTQLDQLERLSRLRSSNAVTADEFAAQKNAIMGRSA